MGYPFHERNEALCTSHIYNCSRDKQGNRIDTHTKNKSTNNEQKTDWNLHRNLAQNEPELGNLQSLLNKDPLRDKVVYSRCECIRTVFWRIGVAGRFICTTQRSSFCCVAPLFQIQSLGHALPSLSHVIPKQVADAYVPCDLSAAS